MGYCGLIYSKSKQPKNDYSYSNLASFPGLCTLVVCSTKFPQKSSARSSCDSCCSMHFYVSCLLGQKFWLDTPRTDSSLQRITNNLLQTTREYGDILVCQYPLEQTLKNDPSLLNGIAHCTSQQHRAGK